MANSRKPLKSYYKYIVILFFSCVLASCASGSRDGAPEDSRRSDCIYESSIRGYVVLDESNLIIEASGRRKYHLGLQRRAIGIRSTWGILFDSPTSRVCSYSKILFDGQFGGESIPISFIREISREEEQTLLIRFGKKEPEFKTTPAPAEVPGAEVEELDPAATGDPPGN